MNQEDFEKRIAAFTKAADELAEAGIVDASLSVVADTRRREVVSTFKLPGGQMRLPMTPAQARSYAAALLSRADDIEPMPGLQRRALRVSRRVTRRRP